MLQEKYSSNYSDVQESKECTVVIVDKQTTWLTATEMVVVL